MSTLQHAHARPKRLRSGEWGAVVESTQVQRGDTVQVTARSGKSWTATVDKVIWSGDGVTIVATGSGGGHSSGRRGRWTGCACGSREDEWGALIPSERNCSTCEFDEYDM